MYSGPALTAKQAEAERKAARDRQLRRLRDQIAPATTGITVEHVDELDTIKVSVTGLSENQAELVILYAQASKKVSPR